METSSSPEPNEPPTHASPPDPPVSNSMLESAGHLADDPFWDEMMDSIRRHRLEMDSVWATAE